MGWGIAFVEFDEFTEFTDSASYKPIYLEIGDS